MTSIVHMRVPLKRTRLTAWPQHTGNRVTLVETLLTLGGATTCLHGKALTRCALASKQRSLLVTCCAKGAWCLHACALPQSHSSNLPQKGLPFSTPQMQELRKCRTEKQGKDRHRPQTDSHPESKESTGGRTMQVSSDAQPAVAIATTMKTGACLPQM